MYMDDIDKKEILPEAKEELFRCFLVSTLSMGRKRRDKNRKRDRTSVQDNGETPRLR